jgi:hypothetical protein
MFPKTAERSKPASKEPAGIISNSLFKSKKKVQKTEETADDSSSSSSSSSSELLKSLPSHFLIGLVEFLIDREVITLTDEIGDTDSFTSIFFYRDGKYYKPKSIYAFSNFNISLLPVKLNLPMVCKPSNWDVIPQLKNKGMPPKTIRDLTGGYLSTEFGRDFDHFYIVFDESYHELCRRMNGKGPV